METTHREGNVVCLTTPYNTYNYSYVELIEAEMQNSLGYVIASHFGGTDRDAGSRTMELYKEAIMRVL